MKATHCGTTRSISFNDWFSALTTAGFKKIYANGQTTLVCRFTDPHDAPVYIVMTVHLP